MTNYKKGQELLTKLAKVQKEMIAQERMQKEIATLRRLLGKAKAQRTA